MLEDYGCQDEAERATLLAEIDRALLEGLGELGLSGLEPGLEVLWRLKQASLDGNRLRLGLEELRGLTQETVDLARIPIGFGDTLAKRTSSQEATSSRSPVGSPERGASKPYSMCNLVRSASGSFCQTSD